MTTTTAPPARHIVGLMLIGALAALSPAGAATAAPVEPTVPLEVHTVCGDMPQAGVDVWAGAAYGRFHGAIGTTSGDGNLNVQVAVSIQAPLGWTFDGHTGRLGQLDGAGHTYTVDVCAPTGAAPDNTLAAAGGNQPTTPDWTPTALASAAAASATAVALTARRRLRSI